MSRGRSAFNTSLLDHWETAARYLMYGGIGILVLGVLRPRLTGRSLDLAAWSLALGSIVRSGSVGVLALGGPSWLGMVTPLGGLLMIAAFFLLSFTALRTQ